MTAQDAAPTAAVVGAGPAGLIAAETLAREGIAVIVYDRMPSVGRKLLMAGRGGLNLTHTDEIPRLLARYAQAEPRLRPAIEAFPPEALRAWCETLGQTTFVGSSGHVFPIAMKASPLLRAWLARLDAMGVRFIGRHRWTGWDSLGGLTFDGPQGSLAIDPDAAILAMGGASWPHLGSDGRWVDTLTAEGIAIKALEPSNCGFAVPWSPVFVDRFEGEPLKGVALTFSQRSVRGEALITRTGLEGGAVYALSGPLREAIKGTGEAILHMALRPDLALDDMSRRLAMRGRKQSMATALRKTLHLAPVAIGLLHEAALSASDPLSTLPPDRLAALINAVPIRLTGTASIARAISTAGGIAFDEVDDSFMLRRRPGTFVAGEMLDWEAPTGGYLLQACFATGAAAGRGASAWLHAVGRPNVGSRQAS